MSKQLIERKERGRLIAHVNGLVKSNSETSYTVSSQSGNGSMMSYLQPNLAGIAHAPTLHTEVSNVNTYML